MGEGREEGTTDKRCVRKRNTFTKQRDFREIKKKRMKW